MKKIGYICVHNSCRSQIAEALTKLHGKNLVEVYSAGTEVKDKINQDAVRLIKNKYGIDMEKKQYSKLISQIPEVDYIVKMGCDVVCPILPYEAKIEDWGLDDPTGKSDEEFIKVMEEIESKVQDLLNRLK